MKKLLRQIGRIAFPTVRKLTTGPAGELLSPDYLDELDKRPIFDWDTVIRTGGIVYVGLDALSRC